MEHFAELLKDKIHLAALAFMMTIYVVRLIWLFRFPAGGEITPARGSHGQGIVYSMVNFALPWTLPSYRQHWFRYVEFAIFHIGIAITITANLTLPHFAYLFTPTVILLCRIFIGLGFVAGLFRLIKRMARPEMRIISSKDDYFSLIILDIYLIAAFIGVGSTSVWATIAFFGMTTFFLLYVPFSKISHYLYYPFNKYYVGKHLGHRGVFPKSYQKGNFKA